MSSAAVSADCVVSSVVVSGDRVVSSVVVGHLFLAIDFLEDRVTPRYVDIVFTIDGSTNTWSCHWPLQ